MNITVEQNHQILAELTGKDHKSACAFTEKIIAKSHEGKQWYEYFFIFVFLLDSPNSLVRTRSFYLLAANTKWDTENRFDAILPKYLSHIEDEKPISARQCIKALAQVGQAIASNPPTMPDFEPGIGDFTPPGFTSTPATLTQWLWVGIPFGIPLLGLLIAIIKKFNTTLT